MPLLRGDREGEGEHLQSLPREGHGVREGEGGTSPQIPTSGKKGERKEQGNPCHWKDTGQGKESGRISPVLSNPRLRKDMG